MNQFETGLLGQMKHLRSYARHLTRTNLSDTEDLVQDTVLRAWKKQHLYQEGTNLQAWLISIMHNTNVNRVRKSNREAAHFIDGEHDKAVPPRQDHVIELRECERELTKLPPEQQQAIKLVGLEGLKYDEVAAILSVPVGTVRSRLSRGRDELRERAGMPKVNFHNYPKRHAIA